MVRWEFWEDRLGKGIRAETKTSLQLAEYHLSTFNGYVHRTTDFRWPVQTRSRCSTSSCFPIALCSFLKANNLTAQRTCLLLEPNNSRISSKPSVELSQKQELAVWRPAPFFCMMTHVTKRRNNNILQIHPESRCFQQKPASNDWPIYLNGLLSFVSWLRHCSTTFDVHWFTLLCWYAFPPMAPSIDYRKTINLNTTANLKDNYILKIEYEIIL